MEIEKILDDLAAWRDEAPERRAVIVITAELDDENEVISSAIMKCRGEKAAKAITASIVDAMSKSPIIRRLMILADSILRLKLNNK